MRVDDPHRPFSDLSRVTTFHARTVARAAPDGFPVMLRGPTMVRSGS
jgi:hypothetical protein